MALQRHSSAFPAILSMALSMAPVPALAGLVVSGSTATFSNGVAINGIVSGRDFFTPPVTTLNVSNLYGDIWPDRPWYGDPGQNPGISLTHWAADGSSGGFGADGHSGAAGLSLTINLQGPWYDDWGGQEAGIQTSLWYNNGIQAISVGGNGGNGGDAYVVYPFGGDGGHGGNGGAINLSIATAGTNFISTFGDGAQGVFALSQGGNGGHGGGAYSIGAVGGDGGRGGNGGNVNLSITASVGTYGKNSNGLLAQSLGGASGYGGEGGGLFGGGGAGSTSGKGGTVDVTTGTAGIWTFGQESHGILAQSIGGFARGAGTGGGVLGWGGSGASSGDGGFVIVTNNGLIQTRGVGSHAIFGQSVGGGGGNAGIGAGILAIGGNGSAGGNGGIVVISNYGFLRTYADSALGILAQSIGGGRRGRRGGRRSHEPWRKRCQQWRWGRHQRE